MNVTQAIQEATNRIRVIPFGNGYQVIRPYYGLNADDRATTCSNSMTFSMALVHCRNTRITEVFDAVTGDREAATDLRYEMECTGYGDGEDWRTVVRRAILEYNERKTALPSLIIQ